jgi:hypothetical protein
MGLGNRFSGSLEQGQSMLSVRKIVWRICRFALPVFLLAWLLTRVSPEQWDQLRDHSIDWKLIGAAILVTSVAICLSFTRWWLLVRSLEIPITYLEGIQLGGIGYLMSYVAPGSVGGDLVKGVFLAHRSPGKRIEALASVGVDRVFGLLGLLIVLMTSCLLLPLPNQDADYLALRRGALLITPLAIAGIIALMLGGPVVDRLLALLLRVPKIGTALYRLGKFVRVFQQQRLAIFMAILLAVCVHTLLVISVDLIARGLFRDTPVFSEHLVIVPAGLAMSTLPITPGGVGVLESVLNRLYTTIPSATTEASGTLVGLGFNLVKLVVGGICVLFYWTAGSDIRKSMQQTKHEPEDLTGDT